MKNLVRINTEEKGLATVFKPYQIEALKFIYKSGAGSGSGKIHAEVRKRGIDVSRASVIFSMNDFVDLEILKFETATGKGGHHRLYSPAHPTLVDAIDILRESIKDTLDRELVIK